LDDEAATAAAADVIAVLGVGGIEHDRPGRARALVAARNLHHRPADDETKVRLIVRMPGQPDVRRVRRFEKQQIAGLSDDGALP
jgi:hypothetical protein